MVIVVSFLPIYVLSGPSGVLFKPMADTMIFALIGSLIVTLTLLPVLCSWLMRSGVRERRNAIFERIRSSYTRGHDIPPDDAHDDHNFCAALLASLLLSADVGAEFMPHLDEGALWVRATMPYTISFDQSAKIVPQIRSMVAFFLKSPPLHRNMAVPMTAPTRRLFNAEFYVGSKPYPRWQGAIRTKPAVDLRDERQAPVLPGHHLQLHAACRRRGRRAEPASRALSRSRSLDRTSTSSSRRGRRSRACWSMCRASGMSFGAGAGQPNLSIQMIARGRRFGINSDINTLIQIAIGGGVGPRSCGKKMNDLVETGRAVPQRYGRHQQHPRAMHRQHHPAQGTRRYQRREGASFIYRENNSRFIGVQFSVEGRDLAGAVQDAMAQVSEKVRLPQGYRTDWGGEYSEYTASRAQLMAIVPLTLLLIFLLLFFLYRNFKFPAIALIGVLMSAPVGESRALAHWKPLLCFVGNRFLALFGVSVQTALVYISYVNELRLAGTPLAAAIREAAILRLRPIMMTALVAALGLLPAALATGVGTDTQRPFAVVIVGGLITCLAIVIFLMPALYTMVAREGDRLEV